MPIVPEVSVFPVYEQGEYETVLDKIEVSERTPFGSADNAPKEKCYRFVFLANDEKGKPILIDGKEMRVFITTGTTYGSKKSTLTKITNQMLGRALDVESEAPRFDYEKLIKLGFKILLSKESNTDGDMRNNVVGITPMQAIDVIACLIPG
jgi:hypothetical protein